MKIGRIAVATTLSSYTDSAIPKPIRSMNTALVAKSEYVPYLRSQRNVPVLRIIERQRKERYLER